MSVDQQQAKNVQVSHRRQWLFVGVAAAVLSTELLVVGVTPAQAATGDQAPTAVSGEKPAEQVTKPAEVVNGNKPGAEKTGTISSDKASGGTGDSHAGTGSTEDDTGDGHGKSDSSESIKLKSKGKAEVFSARMAVPTAPAPTDTDPADTGSDDNPGVTDAAGYTYKKHVDEDGNTTGYDITAYSGDETNITIPNDYQGLKVVGILRGAFSQKGLTSVKLPDSLTYIGVDAFSSNLLTTVEFDDVLENIDTSAFDGNKLTTVVIPNSVKTIGDTAFYQNNISSLRLGDSVETIGNEAFGVNHIATVPNEGVLFIPDSVKTIGVMAFIDNELTGLVIGSGHSKLTSIGLQAFGQMGTLTGTLIIPDSVTTINMAAFVGDNLTKVIFGKNMESIGGNAFEANDLQSIQSNSLLIKLSSNIFDKQKTQEITTTLVDNKFIGVKKALQSKFQLNNISLDDLVFKYGSEDNENQLTYDPSTDTLTTPNGFTGTKLTVSMTSGANSGNYGVDALTIDGTSPSVPVTPVDPTPTDPVTPSQPVNPVDPTTPVTPVQPIKPTKRPTQPKKAVQKQANRHGKPTGQAVTGQRLAIGGRSAGPAMRPTTITSQLKASRQASTQHQVTLPQTGERTKLWTVIGGWLLAILGWFGLGNRRREH